MTTSNLKIIACLTMLTDHIGAILFPNDIVFRIIGRIAFPIFAFLIVEGYFHTKNIKKYLLRLCVFAILSEIPFDLAFNGAILEFNSQNVFFTLFISLVAISIYDSVKEKNQTLATLSLIGLAILNQVLMADYGIMGVLIVFIFYKYRDKHLWLFIWLFIINISFSALFTLGSERITYWSFIQLFEVVALLAIFNYNGKKGLSLRYLFYIFYPGHLLILHIIRTQI